MTINTIGWDIGGAHLKAAVTHANGDIIAIYQQPCPLWKGLDYLQQAVEDVLQNLPDALYRHAITMTGELADLFADRDQGVEKIITCMQSLLPSEKVFIFSAEHGLLPAEQVTSQHYPAIASVNWLASSVFAASHLDKGLFIDIGSTTTDILVIKDNRVCATGFSDFQRLISKELLYTGIVRTAVMAVAQQSLFEGKEIGIMAEYFATMADVYRLTGELNETHDQTDTADGDAKTLFASARRLARMIGCDFYPRQISRWQDFALTIRAEQINRIQNACKFHIEQHQLSGDICLVGAGIGRFLVKQIALDLNYKYQDFSDLCHQVTPHTGLAAADCAPAVGIAKLACRSQI